MNTQEHNKPRPFDTVRGTGRSEARVEVADSTVNRMFPAPADTSPRTASWFSVATVLILVVLAAGAAAAVAATYGPVFTQPLMGP